MKLCISSFVVIGSDKEFTLRADRLPKFFKLLPRMMPSCGAKLDEDAFEHSITFHIVLCALVDCIKQVFSATKQAETRAFLQTEGSCSQRSYKIWVMLPQRWAHTHAQVEFWTQASSFSIQPLDTSLASTAGRLMSLEYEWIQLDTAPVKSCYRGSHLDPIKMRIKARTA